VRVVHPSHPLSGQVVKVIRQASGHPGYAERCWVVELADRTHAKLPLSWAVPLDEPGETAPGVAPPLPDGPWVDVAGLLDLASMVASLTSHRFEEVAADDPARRSVSPPAESRADPAAALAGAAGRTPPRAGRHPGGAGHAPTDQPAAGEGGEP
jgi:hypothetical protein